MEIERFIEKDILSFLDKKASEIADQAAHLREEEFSLFEITSDYSKELNAALKDGNISKARQILEDVKLKYLQSQEGSISKKRLYSVMEEMYERIKDFEEGNNTKSLLDTIKGYEKKVLLSNENMFENKEEEAISLIFSTINLKEKELEDILSKVGPTFEDIEQATSDYKELKALVERIPGDKLQLRNKMSEKTLAWYKKIRKAMVELSKPIVNVKDPIDEVKNLDEKLAEIRIIKEKIVTTHDIIFAALSNSNLIAAVEGYRKLKNLCETFPKDLPEEKTALIAEAIQLYEKISELKVQLQEKQAANTPHHTQAKEQIKQTLHVSVARTREAPREQPKTNVPVLRYVHSTSDKIHDLLNEIDVSHKKIDEHLAQGDIKGAVVEYTHLKTLCNSYPKENDPDEKVTLLSGALAAFESIRRTKEGLSKKRKQEEDKLAEEKDTLARFEELRKELLLKINKVKEFLAQKDSQNAIKAYADLKEFFNNYPDDELEKKKQLYEEILSAHFDMNLLEKDFKNKSIMSPTDKIAEIKLGIKAAESLVSKGMLENAGHEIIELKHKIALLPRENFEEKYNLLKEAEEVSHKLMVEKNLESAEDKKSAMIYSAQRT